MVLGNHPCSVSLSADSTLNPNDMASLELRFTSFVNSLINAEVIDEIDLDSDQRAAEKPDFFFYDRQFIAEMKCLKQDMKDKADVIMEKHEKRPEYPLFFGEWLIDKVLQSFPDRDQIMNEIGERLTSGLYSIVKKSKPSDTRSQEEF